MIALIGYACCLSFRHSKIDGEIGFDLWFEFFQTQDRETLCVFAEGFDGGVLADGVGGGIQLDALNALFLGGGDLHLGNSLEFLQRRFYFRRAGIAEQTSDFSFIMM